MIFDVSNPPRYPYCNMFSDKFPYIKFWHSSFKLFFQSTFEFFHNFFLEILGLAGSICDLSSASRKMRTTMWSALQATVLYAQNPELASGEVLPDDLTATSGPKPGSEEKPESEAEEMSEVKNERQDWEEILAVEEESPTNEILKT